MEKTKGISNIASINAQPVWAFFYSVSVPTACDSLGKGSVSKTSASTRHRSSASTVSLRLPLFSMSKTSQRFAQVKQVTISPRYDGKSAGETKHHPNTVRWPDLAQLGDAEHFRCGVGKAPESGGRVRPGRWGGIDLDLDGWLGCRGSRWRRGRSGSLLRQLDQVGGGRRRARRRPRSRPVRCESRCV